MNLTIQALVASCWQDIATLQIIHPEKGSQSPCKLGYELEYALQHSDKIDIHACSTTLPVQLMIDHESPHWFRFLDDMVPSGAARRHWVQLLGLQNKSMAEQDTQLLASGTIAPVGNLRIKESLPQMPEDSQLANQRYPKQDVIERNTDFLQYAQQMGAISGGATGAGGEAPKLLVRLSNTGEVWIDTFQDDPENPDAYYLVKFPRNRRSEIDCDILRAEYSFYHALADLGFNTISTSNMALHEGSQYPSLWLPRFDVTRQQNQWHRLGLESVYAMLNKAPGSYLNHFNVIRQLLSTLNKFEAFDQQTFVIEWLQRDLLNLVFGNSDNHGRNTSFLKKKGSVELAPIYDFAPMKADPEGVTRTTTWGSPFEEGRDINWLAICNELGDVIDPSVAHAELIKTAHTLLALPSLLEKHGVPKRIMEMPVLGYAYIDKRLKNWGLL